MGKKDDKDKGLVSEVSNFNNCLWLLSQKIAGLMGADPNVSSQSPSPHLPDASELQPTSFSLDTSLLDLPLNAWRLEDLHLLDFLGSSAQYIPRELVPKMNSVLTLLLNRANDAATSGNKSLESMCIKKVLLVPTVCLVSKGENRRESIRSALDKILIDDWSSLTICNLFNLNTDDPKSVAAFRSKSRKSGKNVILTPLTLCLQNRRWLGY